MLDLRSPLAPISGAIGLVLASLLWLALAGHSRALSRLDGFEQRLAAMPAAGLGRAAATQDDLAGRILAAPLFALTSGPGAVGDVALRLDGVAITAGRKAALISIGGKPSVWLSVGASQDGVTLMDVQSAKATLDTATGFRELLLGDTAASAGGAVPAGPTGSPAPQGFKLPPASGPNGR